MQNSCLSESEFVSKILSAIVIAGLALSLVACSSPGGSDSSCVATPSGSASDSVKVSGKFGVEPKVTVKKGTEAKTTERTVAITGDGAVVEKGNTATVAITSYDATTGKKLSAGGYTKGTESKVAADDSKYIIGLVKGIQCSTVGSRVVAVMPTKEGFGSQSEQAGLGAKDSLLLVIDILDTAKAPKVLEKADGKSQTPEAGFPEVKLAADGTPTLTIPKTDPPTDLKIEVLKKGTGPKVADGASVTVHYVGEIWATGKVFDSSWEKKAPATFPTTGVIAGFGKALVGQTVGSQVVAIIPPAEGYVGGNEQAGISATDTLVFVVDILATQ